MSRKHFVLIAQAIRENIQNRAQREATARALAPAPALSAVNPNFNLQRFLDACIGGGL